MQRAGRCEHAWAPRAADSACAPCHTGQPTGAWGILTILSALCRLHETVCQNVVREHPDPRAERVAWKALPSIVGRAARQHSRCPRHSSPAYETAAVAHKSGQASGEYVEDGITREEGRGVNVPAPPGRATCREALECVASALA